MHTHTHAHTLGGNQVVVFSWYQMWPSSHCDAYSAAFSHHYHFVLDPFPIYINLHHLADDLIPWVHTDTTISSLCGLNACLYIDSEFCLLFCFLVSFKYIWARIEPPWFEILVVWTVIDDAVRHTAVRHTTVRHTVIRHTVIMQTYNNHMQQSDSL